MQNLDTASTVMGFGREVGWEGELKLQRCGKLLVVLKMSKLPRNQSNGARVKMQQNEPKLLHPQIQRLQESVPPISSS